MFSSSLLVRCMTESVSFSKTCPPPLPLRKTNSHLFFSLIFNVIVFYFSWHYAAIPFLANFNPFREWSNLNFPCSLTRNITSHSIRNLAFHSLLRWKMIILYNFSLSRLHISLEKAWRMYLLSLALEDMDEVANQCGINNTQLYWPLKAGNGHWGVNEYSSHHERHAGTPTWDLGQSRHATSRLNSICDL